MNKRIFAPLLCGGLLASAAQAEEFPNCNLSPDSAYYAYHCTLSLQDVAAMRSYFKAYSDNPGWLDIGYIQMDKEVSKELATMISESANIASVYMYDTNFDSTALPIMINNDHVRGLGLSKNNLAESDLLSLGANKKYELLVLNEDNLSTQGLTTILDGSQVDDIILQDMTLTEADMNSVFGNHSYLTGITLLDCKVSGYETLKRLPNLEYLGIYSAISSQDVKTIAQLSGLHGLRLYVNDLSIQDMQPLKQLTNLQELHLDASKDYSLGDELTNLAVSFPHLTELRLENQNITDKGAITLSQNTNLTNLELDRNNIGDEGAIAIAHLPVLQHLSLEMNQISDRGGIELANQASLVTLNIGRNHLTDATAMAFAARTAEMDWVAMRDIQFSKAAKEALTQNHHLHYVSFDDEDLDQSQQSLKFMQKYKVH